MTGFVAVTSGVTNVVIPASINGHPVVNIDVDAFYGCTKLTNVVVPASVTNLADKAFDGCTKLTNIIFLGSAPALGANVFLSVPANATIFTGITNGWSSIYDGLSVSPLLVGLTNDAITIVGCNTSNTNYSGKVTIPAVVGAYPVANIGFEAFAFCTNLTSVVIPNNVWNIGAEAFGECSSLTNVVFPASLTTIGAGAFASCTSLARMTIPGGVTYIDGNAFAVTTNLTSITFLGNAPQLGEAVFYWDFYKTITIYYNCNTSGWGTTFGGDTPEPTVGTGVVDGYSVMISGGVVAITGYTGPGGAVAIPAMINGYPVTTIGQDAFLSCTGLTSINIPASVTSIGLGAFNGCSYLTNVTFLGNAPVLGGHAFGSDLLLSAIYYYYGTTGWGTTFDSIPTVELGSAPQIVGGASVQGTNFGFTINASANQTVTVEASTNLVNWQPVWTNTLFTVSTNFIDPQWQNFPSRYYRLQ